MAGVVKYLLSKRIQRANSGSNRCRMTGIREIVPRYHPTLFPISCHRQPQIIHIVMTAPYYGSVLRSLLIAIGPPCQRLVPSKLVLPFFSSFPVASFLVDDLTDVNRIYLFGDIRPFLFAHKTICYVISNVGQRVRITNGPKGHMRRRRRPIS